MGTKVEKNIRISPKYKSSHWKELDLSSGDNLVWAKAVDIFYDRINGRFLAPVRSIEKHSDKNIRLFSGFVILAIDCLLIETLYQFYNGVDETDRDHQRAFWHFFRDSPHFNPSFTRKISDMFYTHFRCGILHQAQTKMSSQVRVDQDQMVQLVNSGDPKQGLIIDRKKSIKLFAMK